MNVIYFLPLVCAFTWSGAATSTQSAKSIGQPLLCYGCIALVQEVHKSLWDSSGSSRSMDKSLTPSALCRTDKFVVYKFSPPKMTKVCDHILAEHSDDLRAVLGRFYKRFKSPQPPRTLVEEACVRKTSCCPEGLPPEGEEKFHAEGLSVEEANNQIKQKMSARESPVENKVSDSHHRKEEL